MKTAQYLKITLASFFSLGLLLFALVGTASAHAKVINSNPKANSTLASAPTTITVDTAENMKPGAQFSNLFVYGPSGELVSQGNGTIPLNNPKQMSITIKPEKDPGTYVVRWITVSADDGDPDQGAFIFTVNPTPAKQATKTTTTSTTTVNNGTPIWVPVVVGIVALLLGLGAGLGLASRRALPSVVTPTETITDQDKTTIK